MCTHTHSSERGLQAELPPKVVKPHVDFDLKPLEPWLPKVYVRQATEQVDLHLAARRLT